MRGALRAIGNILVMLFIGLPTIGVLLVVAAIQMAYIDEDEFP